jgi:hypothetical protein
MAVMIRTTTMRKRMRIAGMVAEVDTTTETSIPRSPGKLGFLAEVLRCKGFEEGYIHHILQLVSGGQTRFLSMR